MDDQTPTTTLHQFGEWLKSWSQFILQQQDLNDPVSPENKLVAGSASLSSNTGEEIPAHWQAMLPDNAPPKHWVEMLRKGGIEWPEEAAAPKEKGEEAWQLDGDPLIVEQRETWFPLFQEGLLYYMAILGEDVSIFQAKDSTEQMTPFSPPPMHDAESQLDSHPLSASPQKTDAFMNPLDEVYRHLDGRKEISDKESEHLVEKATPTQLLPHSAPFGDSQAQKEPGDKARSIDEGGESASHPSVEVQKEASDQERWPPTLGQSSFETTKQAPSPPLVQHQKQPASESNEPEKISSASRPKKPPPTPQDPARENASMPNSITHSAPSPEHTSTQMEVINEVPLAVDDQQKHGRPDFTTPPQQIAVNQSPPPTTAPEALRKKEPTAQRVTIVTLPSFAVPPKVEERTASEGSNPSISMPEYNGDTQLTMPLPATKPRPSFAHPQSNDEIVQAGQSETLLHAEHPAPSKPAKIMPEPSPDTHLQQTPSQKRDMAKPDRSEHLAAEFSPAPKADNLANPETSLQSSSGIERSETPTTPFPPLPQKVNKLTQALETNSQPSDSALAKPGLLELRVDMAHAIVDPPSSANSGSLGNHATHFDWPTLPKSPQIVNPGQRQRENTARRERLNREQRGS